MKTLFELPIAPLVLVSLCWGCTGPSIVPDTPPASFDGMCPNPPTFRMTVDRGNSSPIVSLTSGFLVVNGEMIRMTPTSGAWGPYTYQGNPPNDGEVRYRYMFRYTTGIGGDATDHVVYAPDQYVVRRVGLLSWSSNIPVPSLRDNHTDDTLHRRPRRWISMQDVFTGTSFSGTRSQTAQIIIHNGYTFPVGVSAPSIVDRRTGAAIPGLSIANSAGQTSGYVINVVDGRDEPFTISAQTSITNSQPVFWETAVKFPFTVGATPCWFGPIWVDISFFRNPE